MAIEPLSLPASAPPPSVGASAAAIASSGLKLWGNDQFSFWDLLDFVNPFQHIPVISTLYQEWTGDGLGAVARIAGAGILGGIPGLASALFNVALESVTGKDLGEHVLALFDSDEEEPSAVADITPGARQGPRLTTLNGRVLAQLHPSERAQILAQIRDHGTPAEAAPQHPGSPHFARAEDAAMRDAASAYERAARTLPARAALYRSV